jgi:hypothetical protein
MPLEPSLFAAAMELLATKGYGVWRAPVSMADGEPHISYGALSTLASL